MRSDLQTMLHVKKNSVMPLKSLNLSGSLLLQPKCLAEVHDPGLVQRIGHC